MAKERSKKRVTARITHVPYAVRAVTTAPVPEEKIAYYREIVAADFEDKYFDDRGARPRYFPGGFDRIKTLNATLRNFVKGYKEFAAAQIAAHEGKGYAEYCTTEANNLNHHRGDDN